MAGPITWRNISQNNDRYRGAAISAGLAGESISAGIQTIAKAGENALQLREDSNTFDFQKKLSALSADELGNEEAIRRLKDQYGSALDQDVSLNGARDRQLELRQEETTDTAYAKQKLMVQAEPVLEQYKALKYANKDKEAEAFLDEGNNRNLLEQTQQLADTVNFGLGQDRKEADQARSDVLAGREDYRYGQQLKDDARAEGIQTRGDASIGLINSAVTDFNTKPGGSVTAARNNMRATLTGAMPNAGPAEIDGYLQNFTNILEGSKKIADADKEAYGAWEASVQKELGAAGNSRWQARNVDKQKAANEIVERAKTYLGDDWIDMGEDAATAISNKVNEAVTSGIVGRDGNRYKLSPDQAESIIQKHDPGVFNINDAGQLDEAFKDYVDTPGYRQAEENFIKLDDFDKNGYSVFKTQAVNGGSLSLPVPSAAPITDLPPRESTGGTSSILPHNLGAEDQARVDNLNQTLSAQNAAPAPKVGLTLSELVDQNVTVPAKVGAGIAQKGVSAIADPVLGAFGRAGARLAVQNNGVVGTDTAQLKAVLADPSMKKFHAQIKKELARREK